MMMFTRAAGIVYGLWFFLAPSSYFSLMLVPSEMVNELGIGQTQQLGLALFGIVWWIYRTASYITSDNCSEFMMTHAGGWGIFAAGGLFLTITSGVPVAENPFFYQSVAFLIIALAFYAKRTPSEAAVVAWFLKKLRMAHFFKDCGPFPITTFSIHSCSTIIG